MKENNTQVLRIQYDPNQDHFMIDGTYSFTRPVLVVDGYEAFRKFMMYFDAFMHEVEAMKRDARKPTETKTNQTQPSQMSEM